MAISTFVMTNANGTGLSNPDVLTFLGWVLGSIGQREQQFMKDTQLWERADELFFDCCFFFPYSSRGSNYVRKSYFIISYE